jgi:tRNA/rRNA methyltransferase
MSSAQTSLSQAQRDRLVVVLVATRNPLNLGAAARAMSNFGFTELRVVRPYDASFREARSAVGAGELLARAKEFESVADAVADCVLVVGTTAARDRTPQQPLHSLEKASTLVRRRLAKGRVALLFGSEKRGLSNNDLSHCDFLIRIPTREAHSSMNLGQAVAVSLYEVIRPARTALSKTMTRKAAAADRERLRELLAEAVVVSGYRHSKSLENELRRLIVRLQIDESDARTLLGMLRQILWKLRQRKAEV